MIALRECLWPERRWILGVILLSNQSDHARGVQNGSITGSERRGLHSENILLERVAPLRGLTSYSSLEESQILSVFSHINQSSDLQITSGATIIAAKVGTSNEVASLQVQRHIQRSSEFEAKCCATRPSCWTVWRRICGCL